MQVEIQNVVDVCVIGAGPAGMKAAVRCAEAGASVTVIDEQPRQAVKSIERYEKMAILTAMFLVLITFVDLR